MAVTTWRQSADEAFARGDRGAAAASLRRLVDGELSPADAAYAVTKFGEPAPDLPLAPLRIAVLRSFTIEPVVPHLRARCGAAGIDARVQVGAFNAYPQEILDGGSALYQFTPDLIVVLAALTADVAPSLWRGASAVDGESARLAADRTIELYRGLLTALRGRTTASIIVHTLEQPPSPDAGVLDAQSPEGQQAAIARINDGLRQVAGELTGVYLLDYDGLVARHGRQRWRDEHKWLSMSMPFAAGAPDALAREYMRFVRPLTGRVAKAAVVDLDNTLWGGVIGEDGLAGIRVGDQYPGRAYLECQRALLALAGRGILLAVCSRNNEAEAREALDQHPDMLVRSAHFAAMAINWGDKAGNLRQIAATLNIGVDALAFIDDSPVEREWVRRNLPEVHVIELPADPVGYADAIRESPLFERLVLTAEDRDRGRIYEAQEQRAEVRRHAGSVEEFLQTLEMEVELADLSPMTLARLSQLTQKTNQFNVTTRRYTEAELAELAARPGVVVRSIRVRDRFGDNGIVGLSIVTRDGQRAQVDALLLSCRVIGRGVETALLADLIGRAQRDGLHTVEGRFIPTAKNAPAADVYAKHGFAEIAGEGGRWELDVIRHGIEMPRWMTTRPREEPAQP